MEVTADTEQDLTEGSQNPVWEFPVVEKLIKLFLKRCDEQRRRWGAELLFKWRVGKLLAASIILSSLSCTFHYGQFTLSFYVCMGEGRKKNVHFDQVSNLSWLWHTSFSAQVKEVLLRALTYISAMRAIYPVPSSQTFTSLPLLICPSRNTLSCHHTNFCDHIPLT